MAIHPIMDLDNSLTTTNHNLTVALEEKPGDHQNHYRIHPLDTKDVGTKSDGVPSNGC